MPENQIPAPCGEGRHEGEHFPSVCLFCQAGLPFLPPVHDNFEGHWRCSSLFTTWLMLLGRNLFAGTRAKGSRSRRKDLNRCKMIYILAVASGGPGNQGKA
jgi:hypothetical protein